ncbi:dihydroorotate dehydrogenase electron transfer subunit [Virgibacillus sp. NKC19-16]|uniref:dihydroorotate dehydrogenase electron transfer subunit n=1 Tax=Virgibacillus salidurans TaxID=2831673 RepID=UPI001F3AA701|nr:dihydroorotate dehydrogenase electron transfer subunit [Virgibacillus sp. NKC19-16]UJL47875.1 dihydroorotate dehydrogenase electron transfer subunit [Virgibacillus sp. NKC19-16]
MRKEIMYIQSSKSIALDTVEMVLKNNYISQTAVPGQFLHVFVEGHTLRRPLSIADVDREKETVTILFKKTGSGTKQLATCQEGMTLDVLGPNGNGFNMDNKEGSSILLIGGGIGVPPLYYLGKTLVGQNMKVISILGFQSAESVFYVEKFQSLGETWMVTNDGSYGEKGFVTDVFDKIEAFDRYYSCGPIPMLQAITKKLEHKQGYISLEERMGCGVGACLACVIPKANNRGYKKICKDGPVFHAKEVTL